MKSKTKDTFQAFLQDKVQEKEANKIDWEERKRKWLGSVEQLYESIKQWLQPFIEKDLIKVEDSTKITLNEGNIGVYEIPRLDIYIGNDIIKFVPKGTIIVGVYGRIDIIGTKKDKVMIEADWNKWEFIEKASDKILRSPVNEETIKETIQEVV